MPATLPLSAQDQMISSLFAPPKPTTYAPAAGGDAAVDALGASGLLGNAGKFMSQLSRIQEARKMEQEAKVASEEIGRIPTLDPQYNERVTDVQNRFPMVFGTQPVQSALRRSLGARDEVAQQAQKEEETRLEQDKLAGKQFIRKAGPEQLAQFEEQADPRLVATLGPDMEKRASALGEADTLLQQLPVAARKGIDPNNLIAVKNAVNKHVAQLPPIFSKIKNNPDEQVNAVMYAEQIKALKDKQSAKDYEATEDEFNALTAAQENLENLVGKNPPIDLILKAKPLLGGGGGDGKDWRPSIILNSLSAPLTPAANVGQ